MYLDPQKFELELHISSSWEMFLEVLEHPEPIVSHMHLQLWVRRWRPSDFVIDKMQDIAVNCEGSTEDLKKKVSKEQDFQKSSCLFFIIACVCVNIKEMRCTISK